MCGVLFSRYYWHKKTIKWLITNGYIPYIVQIGNDGTKTGMIITVESYLKYIQNSKEKNEDRNDDSSPSSEE